MINMAIVIDSNVLHYVNIMKLYFLAFIYILDDLPLKKLLLKLEQSAMK